MRTVEASCELGVTPGQALRAWVDVDALRAWWGVRQALVVAEAGGPWVCTWQAPAAGFGYIALSGAIVQYRPGAGLEIGGLVYLNANRDLLGPMTLRVQVASAGTGSVLHLRQDGYGRGADWDWYYDLVRQNWGLALVSLQRFLKDQPPDAPGPQG